MPFLGCKPFEAEVHVILCTYYISQIASLKQNALDGTLDKTRHFQKKREGDDKVKRFKIYNIKKK